MKMPDTIEITMIAPCGVNCLACSAHLSGKKPCPGCRAPVDQITRKSCRDCEIKTCVFEKGFRWCFECERFPCIHIEKLSKRYVRSYGIDLIENELDAKTDMGSFLTSQRERFTCKSCGGIIDQHHRRCSECGEVKSQ